MIQWQFFPKSDAAPSHLAAVVNVFELHRAAICSPQNELNSDAVLAVLRPDLIKQAFVVEDGKRADNGIKVPVLFGKNGTLEKYFQADAYRSDTRTVLEVEAGRGVTNYQFLKDLFQACMMHDVEYLAIAIRNVYKGSPDFDKVCAFFDTLYVSRRLALPLKGILVVGY